MSDNRPIGVFDSGVGGLTVLHAIQHHLPNESTIYVGDLARCPYGPRPQSEVRGFALEIADRLAELEIKALVVACNTATAAAFDTLSTRYAFPVVGVIAPGAREAVRISDSGRIGVIATIGTVESGAYTRAIRRASPGAEVVQASASWLVPLIERGALARAAIAERLEPALDVFRSAGIDTLILGCTHFPIVRDIFDREIGPGIHVLDSAETTARELAAVLRECSFMAGGTPRHRIFVTGPAEAFAERAQAMFRESVEIEPWDAARGAAVTVGCSPEHDTLPSPGPVEPPPDAVSGPV
ncbi:MAG TPA: glutamate racemase [Chloroflexota bacterium]|nr:glutamate racemase [Chloroflexota bacterium]